MAASIPRLHVELYREHLAEASFLYGEQLAYRHDREVSWPELSDLEERFEAHVDGLVVGGDGALEVCRRQAADSDAGELHATLRVLCRQGRKSDVFVVLRALDAAKDERVGAASWALRRDLPSAWRNDLAQLLQEDLPLLTPVLAQVIGYRRFALEDVLNSKLAEGPPAGTTELAWALGRVGTARSAPLLLTLLDGEDDDRLGAAAIALMRLGDKRVVERAMAAASTQRWARRVIAIGGDSRSVRVLLTALRGQAADAEVVIALGLLGDVAAVAPLLELLSDDALSEPAALALNLITGADLYESVFVPDPFDIDELSSAEREAFERDGTLPTRHGQPFGHRERRPLVQQTAWRMWLNENKHRFNHQQRSRMGRAHGPASLFECLLRETSPYPVRAASYEELVIRYGLPVPFEVDLPVAQQRQFLDRIETWLASASRAFDMGQWYFAGSRQG